MEQDLNNCIEFVKDNLINNSNINKVIDIYNLILNYKHKLRFMSFQPLCAGFEYDTVTFDFGVNNPTNHIDKCRPRAHLIVNFEDDRYLNQISYDVQIFNSSDVARSNYYTFDNIDAALEKLYQGLENINNKSQINV